MIHKFDPLYSQFPAASGCKSCQGRWRLGRMRTSLKAGPDLPKRGRSQNMLPPGRTVCQEQHGLHIVKGHNL